jgi:hypothetical protein
MTKELQESTVWKVEPRKNYGGTFLVRGTKISCYTKKQMKSLYPAGDFKRIGEYSDSSKMKKTGLLGAGAHMLPVFRFRAHSRLFYREKGFAAVGEDNYAVLLQNMILPRALILAACAVFIAAGIIFGPGVFSVVKQAINDEDISLAQVSATPDLEQGAVDWQGVQPRDTGGVAAGIAIPGYKSITIDANKTDVKVNFQNPEGNPCYFVISLVLDDGTVLYESKMIEPGKGLYDITLARALSPGEYGAAVKYETYSLADLTPMNGAEVKITLVAE